MKPVSRLSFLSFVLFALTGCGAGLPEASAEAATPLQDNRQALSASALCYAGSCDRQDPGALGCDNDATTLASSLIKNSSGVAVGTIAIRYSPSCRAAWARTSTNPGTSGYLRAEIYRYNLNGTMATAQAAPQQLLSALRSPMLGVIESGAKFMARGEIGPSYGFSTAWGDVTTTIY